MITSQNDRTVSVLNTHRIYQGYVRLDKVRVRIERPGRPPLEFERDIHDHGNAAAVLPYDAARKTAIVVRQLRVPLLVTGDPDPFLVEACAGIIDPDDPDPESAGRREGREETGVVLRDLERAAEVYLCPGTVTERISLFLAPYTEADRIADGGGTDDDEDIDVIELPIAELGQRLAEGAIRDAKLLMLTQALRLTRPELFTD